LSGNQAHILVRNTTPNESRSNWDLPLGVLPYPTNKITNLGWFLMLLQYLGQSMTCLNILRSFYPNLILDKKYSTEDHIKKFMLVVRLMNVQYEDVVCRLFPYTFENKGFNLVLFSSSSFYY
jgi:hypothetical protein